MVLARMIQLDEPALMCDLAETYHIYEYKEMPPTKVAIFVKGLHSDARIMQKLSGLDMSREEFLLANISDQLTLLLWSKTEAGSKGRDRPRLILDALHKKSTDTAGFASGKDFEKKRNELLKKAGGV